MLKDVKLIDVFDKDITAMFQNSKRWFHKFNINNTMILYVLTKLNKQGCLFFKTCNDQKDVCFILTEILVQIYLNLAKNICEIFTKNYTHHYCLDFFNGECFSHAYHLLHKFLCCINRNISFNIYLTLVPNKDYDSNCFKNINWHYLKYIEDKEKQMKNKKS